MTPKELGTIISGLQQSGSSEDLLVGDHIESILFENEIQPWEDALERVKSSVEEIRSAAQFVLEQLKKVRALSNEMKGD